MRNALHLQVMVGAGHVIEQQHSTVPAAEELLQGQDLATVAQRISGEQPQFRKRIEHHPRRLDAFHLFQNRSRRLAEFDFGWMKHRVLRSEEHTSELQSLMRISYAVFCLKKKKSKQHSKNKIEQKQRQ